METQNTQAGSWPDDPLFKHLLEQKEKVKHTIIRDTQSGVEANYDRFLGDVLTSQRILREKLPGDVFDSRGCIVENTVIGILSTGYEFVVALYTILALGGVVFPIPPELSLDGKYQLMKKVDLRSMVVAQKNLSKDVDPEWKGEFGTPVEISTRTIQEYNCDSKSIPKEAALIKQDISFSPKRPAVIMLTSSTSGPAKCVLLPRVTLYALDKPFRSSTDVSLCARMPQRCTGFLDLTDMIYVGGCAEIQDLDKLNASTVWHRLRQGGINVLPTPPSLLSSMRDYFRDSISSLPLDEQACYTRAVEDLRIIWTGGHALAAPVKRFWRDLRKGKPLMFAYGSTELGGLVFWNDISQTNEVRKTSLGTLVPAAEMELTDGDHGELLLRKPSMFLRYVAEPEITQKSFNEEGFLKTSDLVHLTEGKYTLKGRECDFATIGEFRIPLPDITESIQDLSYIAEAYTVAVSKAAGHQIAAIVRLKKRNTAETNLPDDSHDTNGNLISIEGLRSDLSKELRECELPTLLRVLGEGEASPTIAARRKTPSNEVLASYFVANGA